jgi:hypothetical protein
MQAVLLFSDGRQVGGEAKVREPVNLGVPVFAIAAGAPIAHDLSVARWSLPSSHFAGENATLRADIRGIGFRGQSVEVQLRAGEQHLSRQITFDTGQFATVEFPLRFDRGGVQLVELAVDAQPGEATHHNNRVQQLVKVHDRKLRVLALAGHTSREFSAMIETLQRAAAIELTDHVLHRDLDRSELSPRRILEHDVILLSDVRREQLDASQWRAIHQLPSEIGGGVILIASYPGALRDYAAHSETQALLPYRDGLEPVWRSAPGREARFRFAPAAGTELTAALRLEEENGSVARRWDELPAMFHFIALPELKAGVRPLLVERDSAAPVLTEHAAGAGRVLFFGGSETWRWRGDSATEEAERHDHERFWRQLIRHAAETPYAIDAGIAALDAEELIVQPEQPLRVRARVRGASATAPAVQITQEGRVVRAHPLGEAAYRPGRYEALVTGLPAGDYELRLAHPAAADLPPLPVRVEQSLEAEMRLLSGDDARLSQIATASGGEMLRLDEIDQLPAKLEAMRHRRTRLIERSLWDSWHLFAFVLGCLGAEWALRKRFGLV